MSKLTVACGVTLLLTVAAAGPEALAQKVTRDPTMPTHATPPVHVAPAPVPAPNLAKLSAEQVVAKYEAACGGAAAWRAIQSMTITGKLDAGGKKDTLLPYTLKVKRPNKQRMSIEFAGHTAVQVFDGAHGWKLRPYLNRPDPEPYSADELQKALAQPPLEGPLMDAAAKGTRVELEGTEMLDKTPTYRLKLTTKQGHTQHIWIDGSTFLEVKAEANPHRYDGKMRKVETWFRDYRRVGNVTMPYVAETRVDTAQQGRAITIDKVMLNEKMEDNLFAKPPALTTAEMPQPPKMVKMVPTAATAAPVAPATSSR
jgi:outer membrane lipoprotein-sorting protein